MRSARNAAAAALLAAVSFGFFGRFLVVGKTLAYDDLAFWFFPWKSLLFSMAQEGHISFWLSGEFSGMPHMADIQRQIFYPPNVVFYLIPTAIAMVVFVALHFFVGSTLMYAWLRQMPLAERLGVPAALCGALVFGFSAFPLLHLTQLPMLASYTWIPGLMLSLERYNAATVARGRPSAPWLAAGALCYALMLLGGAPQMVYIGSVLAAAYLAFLVCCSDAPADGGTRARLVAAALSVPLLALGLTALQLVPMAELAALTTRQPAVTSQYSTIGTAEPGMLWTLVHPYVYGNPADGTWRGGYTFHEECFYVGVVTLMLALAAFGDVARGGRRLGFFLICALLGVVIALGNNVQVLGHGLHDLTRAVLPFFGKFRVPPRWMVLTVVGMSVLAACGVQALTRARSPHDETGWRGALPLALCFVAFFALAGMALRARHEVGLSVAHARWTLSLVFSTLACAAIARVPGRGAAASAVLVLLLAVDLLTFGSAYVRAEASPALSPNLGILRDLASRPSVGRVVTHTTQHTPTQIATWCGPLGLRNVQGTNPLFLRSYLEYLYYSQAGEMLPASDAGMMHHNGFFIMTPYESPMTRMLNLTDVIDTFPDDGSDPRPGWPLTEKRGIMRRRAVSGALGVAWVVPGYRVARNREEMFAIMRGQRWDPTSEALFDEAPDLSMPAAQGRVRADVTVRVREDDRLDVGATLDRDGVLIFSEIWYPGWECTVDGVATPVLAANGIFRAIGLRAGTHEVALRFRPRSFLMGLAITGGTALLMTLALLAEARRRRRAG